MGKTAQDEMILSYNDVVLRRSDLDILSGPKFLNDRIIDFYFSYISLSYPSEDISLISPSIAFWIANCPDIESLKDFVTPLNLYKKKIILFPINNNNDMSMAEGGTHWSLLVYERESNLFVHHDSCNELNADSAKNLYRAVAGYVGDADTVSSCNYSECQKSPQQKNGYDCGLYTLAIAKAICGWHVSGGHRDDDGLWYSAVNEQVNFMVEARMRSEILELIRSLMDKK